MTKLLQKVTRNLNGHDWVVGDIHGEYNLLMKNLIELEFDQKNDRLFSVGDLVDRGKQNMEVLRFLQRKPWFYAVIGNHESMMMDYVAGLGEDGDYWKRNGGDWFDDLTDSERQELEEILVPWLYENLPYVIEIDHERGPVFISHAVPLPEYNEQKIAQNTHELMWDRTVLQWARSKYQNADKMNNRFQHITYHGHTPLKSPFKAGNTTWLDTGAFATGNLTIVKI